MLHKLKINSEYFVDILKGTKTFEIRKNDRDFKVGDRIKLREIDVNREYTGRSITATITYITDYEQKNDYVVFAFKSHKKDTPH